MITVYSPDKAISDHSMIRWELSLEGMCCAEPTTDVASDWISSKTTYKLEEISSDFFNSEAAKWIDRDCRRFTGIFNYR